MLGASPTVQRVTIAWGDAGVRQTLDVMRQMVLASAGIPSVVETARSLAYYGGAAAIRQWMSRVWRFVPDPAHTELLATPEYLLQQLDDTGQIVGDCDDAAVLGAALGEAIGLEATFTVLAFDEGAGPTFWQPIPRFSHVFASLLTPDGRTVNLDVTRPLFGSVAPVVRSLTVAV